MWFIFNFIPKKKMFSCSFSFPENVFFPSLPPFVSYACVHWCVCLSVCLSLSVSLCVSLCLLARAWVEGYLLELGTTDCITEQYDPPAPVLLPIASVGGVGLIAPFPAMMEWWSCLVQTATASAGSWVPQPCHVQKTIPSPPSSSHALPDYNAP